MKQPDKTHEGKPGSLPLSTCVAWGVGTLAVAALFNSVNVLLLRYLVDYAGLTAAIAGMLLAASKVYDAFIDPLVGHLSDKTRSPMGRRRPFLLAGGILLAIAALVLFNVPSNIAPDLKLAYVLMALLLYATGYAVFSIPYMAMPAEMTSSFYERSKLISYRVTFVAVASLIATFIGPQIMSLAGGGQQGHSMLAILLAAIILISTLACFHGTRHAPHHYATSSNNFSTLKKARMIFENRPFIMLLVIKLCQLMALAVTQASMPFLFSRVLELNDAMLGLYFLLFYAAMILVQPIWIRFSKSHGKRSIYMACSAFYGLLHMSWYFVEAGDPLYQIYTRAILLGAGAGGVLLMGQSLLPDTMEWDYHRTGLRREGVLSAIYTVFEKLAFAFGAAVTGIFLGLSGYIQGTGSSTIQQPESAITAIYLLASFIPMGLLLGSCIAIGFYKLTEKTLNENSVTGNSH